MNLKHHKFNKQLIKNITILQDLQDRDRGDMGIFSMIVTGNYERGPKFDFSLLCQSTICGKKQTRA